MIGVGVTSLLLILGVFCSASWADQCASRTEFVEAFTECFAPWTAASAGMNASEINNLLANSDLRLTCGLVTAVRDCVRNLVTECENKLTELQIPNTQEWIRNLRILNDYINYICVDHIAVFNRNKACLLRMNCATSGKSQIDHDTESQCETPQKDPYCLPASYPDCVAGIVQRQCGARIADTVRNLFQQIAANYGICDGRRRFKLMMKKKEMKKKELFSPMELMRKTFPSLF